MHQNRAGLVGLLTVTVVVSLPHTDARGRIRFACGGMSSTPPGWLDGVTAAAATALSLAGQRSGMPAGPAEDRQPARGLPRAQAAARDTAMRGASAEAVFHAWGCLLASSVLTWAFIATESGSLSGSGQDQEPPRRRNPGRPTGTPRTRHRRRARRSRPRLRHHRPPDRGRRRTAPRGDPPRPQRRTPVEAAHHQEPVLPRPTTQPCPVGCGLVRPAPGVRTCPPSRSVRVLPSRAEGGGPGWGCRGPPPHGPLGGLP
jgi:hypothetical protein